MLGRLMYMGEVWFFRTCLYSLLGGTSTLGLQPLVSLVTSCDQLPPSDVGICEFQNKYLCLKARDSSHWCNVQMRTRVMFIEQIRLEPKTFKKSGGVRASPHRAALGLV